ncbi:phage holin family protein [Kocuria sp. p3-SID1433]|uniref:phage holin family protein n=1 Tax=unclassified Kocuria TaxID=2649579 RepID=UPI0021A8B824|nr:MULTISPECIES: phage holin family protein [unclassified Kocuria]MCT1601603.1 phage holin family protein [Kocuria sp. p3-SID1428]MCT2179492.1 phage holin family protein [Kocuria sp. p3-SID1433]
MLWRWLVNSLAVALATALVPGIHLNTASLGTQILVIVIAAAVLGAFNAVVKPVLQLLTGCLIVLTFGLFLIVINAVMLLVVSTVMEVFGGYWVVESFWPSAVLGSLVISLVSMLMGAFEPRRREVVVVERRAGAVPGRDPYGRPVRGAAQPPRRSAADTYRYRGDDGRIREGEIYDPEDPTGRGR